MRFSSVVRLLGSLMVVGAAVCASAQMTAQMPNANGNAAQYSPDSPEANSLQLGLGFTSTYDSNAFNTVQGNGQLLLSPNPSVAWNIARGHWMSDFKYDALISRSTRYDFYSRTSHNLDTTFFYQFSKALSFTVKENFVRSADPLYSTGQLATGGIQNPSYFGQPTLRTSNMVDAEADYRLDAHSDLTIGGSYYFQRYSQIQDASLRDSNDAMGRAGYHHAISPRMKVGASYDYTKITTPSGFSTVSQRIMVTDDYSFKPTMTLSLFAGPNHVANDFVFAQGGLLARISSANWSWSAGGSYSWNTSKMTMTGSAIRQVSDGGGLVGTVQLTSFQYSVKGQLPYKLSGSASVGYTLNDRLIPQTGGSASANFGTAGVSITRAITRNLNFRASYDRMEQMLPGFYAGDPWIDRNRITLSINYLFTHPLGR